MNITDHIALMNTEAGWDGDMDIVQLYQPTLQVDIGDFKKGDKPDCVTFDMNKSKVQIISDDGIVLAEANIKLVLDI